MTRGQLVERVARKTSLSTAAGDDELIAMQEWANEAVIDVLMKTHCRVEVGDMALTAAQDTYRVDDAVLAVQNKRITSVNRNYNLEVVPMEEVLDLQRGTSGNPFPYKIAIEGTLMVVFPAPILADTIRWIYVPRPTAMTADGTTGSDANDPASATFGGVPSEYHRALEYYMLWQATEYGDKTAILTTKDYAALYAAEIVLIKKELRKRRSRGLQRGRVGYPGTTSYPSNNDVYPSGSRA